MTTIGIDFGISSIRAACVLNGEVISIPNIYGKYVTPAAITIDDNNEICIGEISS